MRNATEWSSAASAVQCKLLGPFIRLLSVVVLPNRRGHLRPEERLGWSKCLLMMQLKGVKIPDTLGDSGAIDFFRANSILNTRQ